MVSAARYLDTLASLITEIAEAEATGVREAGLRVGESIADGGILHLFGSGHSRLAAEDICVRAGTLTTSRTLWADRLSDKFERTEGLGRAVLDMSDISGGEVLVVISNSGINPLPIDVALEGKNRGAFVIGIGSQTHGEAVASRHSSRRRLPDVVDLFLDTHVPAGDALIELPDCASRVGPASTIAASALLHAVVVEAVEWLASHGFEPPVRVSRNLPGGDEHNAKLNRTYRERIPELSGLV